MRHLMRKSGPLALTTALALTLAACGGGGGGQKGNETKTQPKTQASSPAEHGEAAAADPFDALKAAAEHVGPNGSAKALASGIAKAAKLQGSTDSKAATTYASLSSLLGEHVYLAGIAVDTGVNFGLDSPEFKAAAGALDENSVALSQLVGSVAGPDNEQAFLQVWRQHIGFFVDYTNGAATNNPQLKQQALASLDGYRMQAGAFFEKVTGGALPASAVATELKGHIQTLTAAIDAAVAKDPTVFAKLRQAAHHVNAGGSSKALTGGIAKAAQMEGSVNDPAAQAYAKLSNILQEHVYLSGLAVKTAFASGLDSPAFKAAAETLDENSVELSQLVGSVAGPDNEQAFLQLWREHIGFFVDYAKGTATNNPQLKQQALASLDGYRMQAGAFFEKVTGGALPATAVAESLKGHIQTLTKAIDSLAAVVVKK
ncbi:MAG: hypothetical protein M3O70_16625 [Actinomycetota bacterium]|nr:hypothetical protein [Actinomycetota bacterium]